MLCQQNSKHFTKIRKLQTSPWDGCDDVATGRCVQGRGETPLPADKRKFDVCFMVGCGEREKTRNMYIAVITLFFVQLPNSPWDGSGDAATGGKCAGKGGHPLTCRPAKIGGRLLGWMWRETENKNSQSALFFVRFKIAQFSPALSLQLQQLVSCSSFVGFLLWGDGGRAQKKSLAFPKNLFHFASHCLLLVSMECALQMFSRLFSLHRLLTYD